MNRIRLRVSIFAIAESRRRPIPEWAENSRRWIAEMCGVSHTFVSSIRCQVVTVTTSHKGGHR